MTEKKNPILKIAATSVMDHSSEILTLLRSHLTPAKLGEKLRVFHEKDIADAYEQLSIEERARLYFALDAQMLADIMEYSDVPGHYLKEFSLNQQAKILSRMEIQYAQDYIHELNRADRLILLELIDRDVRQKITLLETFDEDEIGSRMSNNYIYIPTGLTVRKAMRMLVEQAADHDNISTIYVVDDRGIFAGAIDLKALIIARENTPLEQITMFSYPYVYANELIEDCIDRIKEYAEDSIPILDSENKLRGVLTAQDIAEMIDQEMSDDYAKLAGLSSEEDLQEPLGKSVKKRLPWLVVLLGLGLIVSTVVGLFEGVIAHLTVIISFQSLILDMAGNVGTQSLAVTIRVLMDDQISGKDKITLVQKEAKVGMVNGLLLGTLSIAFIGLYLTILKGYTLLPAFAVALCTAIALLLSIVLSSICGTIIPMIFQKLKVDPAVASGPLITTINDLIAVVTYYGLAWLLLINVLHL